MMKKRFVTSTVAATTAVLTLALGIPTTAIAQNTGDVVSESDTTNVTSANAIPENPTQELPDKVADSIPEDSTLVSQDLATDDKGNVYNVETGEKVADPKRVGTKDEPADPLAKTDGESFIPVDLSDVKDKIEDSNSSSSDSAQSSESAQTSTQASARTSSTGTSGFRSRSAGTTTAAAKTESQTESQASATTAEQTEKKQSTQSDASSTDTVDPNSAVTNIYLPNNEYGAYWGTHNGTRAFFQSNGQLFVQQAQGVIDVSQWQGDINWNAVKASGNVQGAIIRIGYGSGNRLDLKAARNISEVKRLGIPFGVYWYSYSDGASASVQEAKSTVAALRQLGISPSDLSYPVYYDMERWTWGGHTPPTDPNVNAAAMRAYLNELNSSGYTKNAVYSYTSYLNSSLRHNDIWSRTTWVAQYGARMGFTAWNTNFRGWQYSSSGTVSGISGHVDINAFGNYEYRADFDIRSYPLVNIPNGDYYINPRLSENVSMDVPGASRGNGALMQVYGYNKSTAQRFRFTRNSDGSYSIVNVNSGKALDISAGNAHNYARIQQYDSNGSTAQRWYIRNMGNGYAVQSALGNWVLDLNGASTANGNAIQLYTPNGSDAQKFFLASSENLATNTDMRIATALNSSKVLDIASASTQNSVPIQVWDWNGTAAQTYQFREVGNGTYTIVNKNSNKVIDVAGNSGSDGARVDQYDSNGSAAQQWILHKNSDGTYSFQGRGSGKFAELPGGRSAAGTQMTIYTGNGTTGQRWHVNAVTSQDLSDLRFAQQHKNDLVNDTYTFNRPNDKKKVMEVPGASHDNFAKIKIYDANGSKAQEWKITRDSNGYAIITNVESGKVLNVDRGIAQNWQSIGQYTYNDTDAQKWIAVKNSNGTYTFYSKLNPRFALDVDSNSTANGTNLELFQANGTTGQQWNLETTSFVGKHRNDLPDGTFEMIRPNAKRMVMDLAGSSAANGTNVQLYTVNHSDAQMWLFAHDEEGYVMIRNRATGKSLDLPGGRIFNGQNVQQYHWNRSDAQKWIAVKNSDGTYTFYSKLNPEYALDVSGNGTWNYTNVQVYKANGSMGQKWEINSIISYEGLHKYDIDDGTYTFMRPQNNRAVLDLAGASHANYANVRIYQSNGTAAQKWVIKHVKDNYVAIYNAASGKVLDVDSGIARNYQGVQQYQWNGTYSQLWVAVLNANGTYTFRSALDTSYALDVNGDATWNGARIQIYKANNSNGQQWKIQR